MRLGFKFYGFDVECDCAVESEGGGMKLCINHEISRDGCRKRMRDTSLIKIKLHTPIYGI